MTVKNHPRLPEGSHKKDGPLPDGLIYEDIIGVLMVLFRSQFTMNRGQDYEG